MRSIVLLSAGLDSVVNLAQAVTKTDVVAAITYFYGQKSALKEIERAEAISARYAIPHAVIDLGCLPPSDNALTGPEPLPEISEKDLDDPAKSAASADKVWVPNRNGVFINVGAASAEANHADQLVVGFNAEEAASFPDNGKKFVEAANLALSYSTKNHVRVVSYTLELLKSDIINMGLELKVPFDLIWSCYDSGELMCGVCESCVRFKRAATTAGAAYLNKGRFAVDN
jgi:7-cyano-7-deazaguanine synthase